MPLPLTVIAIPGPGAEDVLVARDGRVWTGTADGAIHVHDPATRETTTVAATGGRPLGLELLPDGRILVCDAHRGLLALDPATGALETLLTEVDGERLLFTNNAAVTVDGTIWFSDSSRVWPIEEWKSDLIEHTCTGRLFRRTPDGHVDTVIDRLCFANGVALTAEADAVLVAETGTRTIRRVSLGADGSPRATTTWVDDLPGHPDNIALGSDGLVWVTVASPTDRALTLLQKSPRAVRGSTPPGARSTTSSSTPAGGTSRPEFGSRTGRCGSAASSNRPSPWATCPGPGPLAERSPDRAGTVGRGSQTRS